LKHAKDSFLACFFLQINLYRISAQRQLSPPLSKLKTLTMGVYKTIIYETNLLCQLYSIASSFSWRNKKNNSYGFSQKDTAFG